jgi:hypothetical protein
MSVTKVEGARKVAVQECDCPQCAEGVADMFERPEWFAPPADVFEPTAIINLRAFKVAVEDVPTWMERLARSDSGNWIVSHDGTVVINDKEG